MCSDRRDVIAFEYVMPVCSDRRDVIAFEYAMPVCCERRDVIAFDYVTPMSCVGLFHSWGLLYIQQRSKHARTNHESFCVAHVRDWRNNTSNVIDRIIRIAID